MTSLPLRFKAIAAAGGFLCACCAFTAAARVVDNPLTPPVIIDGVDISESVYTEPVPDIAPWTVPNYRDTARDVINRLVEYAHARDPNFPVLIRGGEHLAFQTRREHDLALLKLPEGAPASRSTAFPPGTPFERYIRNIAGVVMDQHYCQPVNPSIDREGIGRLQSMEVAVLSLERCYDIEEATAARDAAGAEGVLADIQLAGEQAFRTVPPPDIANVNVQDVRALRQAKSVLVVLESRGFDRIEDWVKAMAATNHDVLIVDPFFKGKWSLNKEQVDRLKHKALGPRRLVVARLPVGLAYDTMPYWKSGWQVGNPPFLTGHFPHRTGVYWTDIMNQQWLALIGSGFAATMDLGFDGIMLDGVTTFLRDEALNPI